MLTQAEYTKLVDQLKKYAEAYYSDNTSLISDSEYDELLRQANEFEIAHPLLADPKSPTQTVGQKVVSHLEEFEHKIRLPSLGNVFDKDELTQFVIRIQNEFPEDDQIEFTVEPKIDGLAVACHYTDGRFIIGGTRGDGTTGENVTHNLTTVKSLPKKLIEPVSLEVRGEVFMRKSVFQHLSDRYANPRNTAAGTLRQLDASKTEQKKLDFFAYQALISLPTHFEILTELNRLGFKVVPDVVIAKGVEGIWAAIETFTTKRESFDWEIDGVVIKVNRIDYQQRLGSTAKSPRWAMAYKFKAAQSITRLKSVTVQVGRTGILTPVAELQPVSLGGTTISRATLHNWDDITRKNIKIGDDIVIQRAGDVIPEVVKSAHTFPNSQSIPIPKFCPSCNTSVEKAEHEVAIRCPNPSCPSQTIGRIIHFCSRNALDITGLGEAVITQLIDAKLIETIPDLYKITKDQLESLERFADRSAEKLIDSINNSKSPDLEKFIFALGIPFVGSRTAQLLANHYQSIDSFRNATLNDLVSIHEIGEKIAQSVIDTLKSPTFNIMLDQLLAAGVNPNYIVHESSGSPFSQKTCLITGTLQSMSRIEAESKIMAQGGRIVSGVSKTLNYLIVGDNPGSKLAKAQAINAKFDSGIKILSEPEFLEHL